jgi:hypothetical protein
MNWKGYGRKLDDLVCLKGKIPVIIVVPSENGTNHFTNTSQ